MRYSCLIGLRLGVTAASDFLDLHIGTGLLCSPYTKAEAEWLPAIRFPDGLGYTHTCMWV